jgi:hypothetical protein
VTGQGGLAPGVIKVRLSGALPDMEVLTAILRQHGAIEVLDASSPYPNRRDPGVRVYLTVWVAGEIGDADSAIGNEGSPR